MDKSRKSMNQTMSTAKEKSRHKMKHDLPCPKWDTVLLLKSPFSVKLYVKLNLSSGVFVVTDNSATEHREAENDHQIIKKIVFELK